jgi:hypothetical protein
MRPFHHGLIESMSPLRSLRFFARFAFSLIANAARTLGVALSLKIKRKETQRTQMRSKSRSGRERAMTRGGSGESFFSLVGITWVAVNDSPSRFHRCLESLRSHGLAIIKNATA